MSGGLAQYGRACYEHGFEDLVPLVGGEKRPALSEWSKFRMSLVKMDRMLTNGQADADVGLLTRRFPCLDIDVYDATVAQQYHEKIRDLLPGALVRVGQPPKLGLICRSDNAFTKITSPRWRDPSGIIHRVEFLASGQQVKIFGMHPDTGAPYSWQNDHSPATAAVKDLPLVDAELAQRIVNEFAACVPDDWTQVTGDSAPANGATGADAFLLNYQPPIGLSLDEMRSELWRLLDVDPEASTDHESWYRAGMATHHESGGSAEGLALWDEWSQTAGNYGGSGETEKRWSSFSDIGASGTKTWRSIRAQLKEAETSVGELAVKSYREQIEAAGELAALETEIAAKIRDDDALNKSQRERLAKGIQARAKMVDGIKPPIADVRRWLVPRRDGLDLSCFDDWVLVGSGNTYYRDRGTGVELSRNGFDNYFERDIIGQLADTDDVPTRPSWYANNDAEIPRVKGVMYLPGEDEFFEYEGKQYLNTYSTSSHPDIPAPLGEADHGAVAQVERHFELLFDDPDERRTVMDYLTHCVQNPGIRPHWALVIQGGQGAGKSTLSTLMRQVLGDDNVSEMPGTGAEGAFNDWAEGQQLMFVEEVRFVGANRYTVLNNISPMIVNHKISIHRKGQSRYQIKNTTAYVLLTNFADALPLSDTDRKYYVAMTAVQNAEDQRLFRDANPKHFEDLHQAIAKHPGAIRAWFLGREISEDFDVRKAAPDSRSKDRMRTMTQSDHRFVVDELLKEGRPNCNQYVLSSSVLLQALTADSDLSSDGMDWNAKRVSSVLLSMEFFKVGRFRVEGESSGPGDRHILWTRHPKWLEELDASKGALMSLSENQLAEM